MKSYLFYILIILPFGFVFSQQEKAGQNNTNTSPTNSNTNINSNSGNIEFNNELKSKKIKETEKLEERTPAVEESIAVPMSVPAARSIEVADKDMKVSFAAQVSHYKNNYKAVSEQRTQRSLSGEQAEQMEDMLRDLSSISPASFESYLFYYLNGENDLTRSKSLLKANELKPADAQVQQEMLTYYVLMNKSDETRKALLNLSQNNVYSAASEMYGEDLVQSAPSNATLITHGNEDSYGALYAQKVKREREDVNVISLDWLTSPQYRTKLKSEGWNLPSTDFVDTKYLEQFCALNKDKTIAISMTFPKEYLLPILDKLYVSGLVFEYLDVPTDLSIRNEVLWNSKLNKKLIESEDKGLVNNYLPMLFQLKKIYQADGKSEAVKEIESTIQTITNR